MKKLLEVARLLGASDNLAQILSVIIDAMRDALDADRATVFEYDPETDELFTTVAHGLTAGDDAPAEIRIPSTAGLAGQCATSRAIINVPDAYADERFNRDVDKRTGYTTRSILCIPLLGVQGELIGVAQVLNKQGGPFDDSDEEIAGALASHAAVAIKRARMIEDRVVREKLEKELELAGWMQRQTFPEVLPALPGYDVAGWSRPADETGGDAFDVVGLVHNEGALDVGEPGGYADSALFLLGDATGHGVGPALSVTQARSMLRMGLRVGAPLERLAVQMNAQLHEDLPPGRFITVWLAFLDAHTHTLRGFSAGQAPLLHFRAGTDEVVELSADTVPMGIAPDLPIESPTDIVMEPGDLFVVLSDGFYEAATSSGEQFGTRRIAQLIREHASLPARDLLDRIRTQCDAFSAGEPQADDQTAVIIRRVRPD